FCLSSRRRHTRSKRDWSSDVCSSDLSTEYPTPENIELARGYDAISTTPYALGPEAIRRFHELGVKYLGARAIGFDHFDLPTAKEIGRASCRERAEHEAEAAARQERRQ